MSRLIGAAVLEDVFRDEPDMSIQLNLVNDQLVPNSLILPSQLTRRVDALYLLSLLLTGSQRGKVQQMLAQLGIGPSLSALFEQFLWKSVRRLLFRILLRSKVVPLKTMDGSKDKRILGGFQ